MKKLLALIMAIVFMAMAATCPVGAESLPLDKDSQALSKLTDDNNRFAFSIYKQLKGQSSGADNIFLSPYSISSAMAMTYLGARGETATEIANALSFNMESDKFHNTFKELTEHLKKLSVDGCRLETANRLWGEKTYRFKPEFIENSSRYYGAGLETLDFSRAPENSRQKINAWVEKMTGGLIRELLQKGMVNTATTLILTNAIYFKGEWMTSFDPKKTAKAPFYLSDGKSIQTDTMHKTANMPFTRLEGMMAVKLPYKRASLSMMILLPDEKDGLQALENRLNGEMLAKLKKGFHKQRVELALPKFKAASTFSLGEALQKMGVNRAFSPGQADFTGMSDSRDLFISKVVHKAYVTVDEKGTKAAAATAVVMSRSANGKKAVLFNVDHPFLFLITDDRSGQILFMGRIADPTK